VKRLFGHKAPAAPANAESRLDAERGRVLVEESREIVVVLDGAGRVVTASRRARERFDGLAEGEEPPEAVLQDAVTVPYTVAGRSETLVYVRDPGDLAAYEELRAGFTASVSHELRTPLARLLALLETATLPGADVTELVEQAARAGVTLRAEGDVEAELPLRPRMIRVLAANLAENAIRYAGPGSTFVLAVRPGELTASDDGVGVAEEDLPRLFERFYRADRARASRGTGLGLAIVKHIANSAGGTVEAESERGGGLAIRVTFTSP